MTRVRGKNCATERDGSGTYLAHAVGMMLSEERNADGVVLRLRGTLDAITAPEVRPTFEEIAAGDCQVVIVDLSDVELIDSSGVAVLVALYKQLRAREGALRLRGVRNQPLAVMRLLKLDRIFAL